MDRILLAVSVSVVAATAIMLLVYAGIEREPSKIRHVDRAVVQGAPESWASHQYGEWNTTDARYGAMYENCTLYMTKAGTNTSSVSVVSSLECSNEEGDSSTANGPTGYLWFKTVPSDFNAVWPDQKHCNVYMGEQDSTIGNHSSIMILCSE